MSVNWASYIDSTTFEPLVTGILSLFPTVVAVCVPLMVLRKGWDFLKGNIYSA